MFLRRFPLFVLHSQLLWEESIFNNILRMQQESGTRLKCEYSFGWFPLLLPLSTFPLPSIFYRFFFPSHIESSHFSNALHFHAILIFFFFACRYLIFVEIFLIIYLEKNLNFWKFLNFFLDDLNTFDLWQCYWGEFCSASGLLGPM